MKDAEATLSLLALFACPFVLYFIGKAVCWTAKSSANAVTSAGSRVIAWDRNRIIERQRRREQAARDREEQRRTHEEEERQRQFEVRQRARLRAPIDELIQYYEANAAFLDEFPWPLVMARMRVEMGEGKSVTERWAACHQMIAEMQPLVLAGRQHQRREADLQTQARRRRERRLREIDEEISGLQQEMVRLRNSPLDLDITEDELLGLRDRMRQLEREREEVRNDEAA